MELFKISEINACEIYISSCPKVSEDGHIELPKFPEDTVVLISLLQSTEIGILGLENEAEAANKVVSEFISFPIADMGIPSYKDFVSFIALLFSKTENAKKIIIHCKHGIGRSGLIALGLLVKSGSNLTQAINDISKIRGYAIPQSRPQRKLISLYYKEVCSL